MSIGQGHYELCESRVTMADGSELFDEPKPVLRATFQTDKGELASIVPLVESLLADPLERDFEIAGAKEQARRAALRKYEEDA